MIKKVLLSIVFAIIGLSLSAQDIHFSQFNAAPLQLNPALTGKVECTYRIVANYRNQWNAIPAPYVTYALSFDAALWEKRMNGSSFGIGFSAFNDQSGDGNLTHTNLSMSLAYHAQLGEGHLLSAGFQGAYVSKRIDDSDLLFSTQIGPSGPIIGAPHGEFLSSGFNFIDMNAGIHWSSIISDNFSFNFGGAYYHILEPNESFLGDLENTVQPRYVGHGGFSAGIGEQVAISPSVLYMKQGENTQINGGASLGFYMDNAALHFGGWLRYAGKNPDAIIALIGVEFSNLVFGFSYDVSISEIKTANNNKGGFELSLGYSGCVKTTRKVFHCPKF